GRLALTLASTLALLGGLGLGGSGCGPAVPDHPTWADDVHPLMQARCIRCHQPATVGDPKAGVQGSLLAVGGGVSFDWPTYDAVPADVRASLGLTGTNDTSATIRSYATGNPPSIRMPPPPAAKLQDWEVQLLIRWAASPM